MRKSRDTGIRAQISSKTQSHGTWAYFPHLSHIICVLRQREEY